MSSPGPEGGADMTAVARTALSFMERMRTGGPSDEGPFYCGDLPRAEAESLAEQLDKSAALMLLPTRDGWRSVWLTGDPSHAHNTIASFFVDEVMHLVASLGPDYRRSLRSIGGISSRYVRFEGRIGHHPFNAGTGRKEPDACFRNGDLTPTAAVEVAYRNENIEGLLFEAHMWTAQGSDPGAPIVMPTNFIGIKISENDNQIDRTRPAFAVIIASAASATGHGTLRVHFWNATSHWTQMWRDSLQQTNYFQDWAVEETSGPVDVPLSFFGSHLPDQVGGVPKVVRLDGEVLYNVYRDGIDIQETEARTYPQAELQDRMGNGSVRSS